MSESDRHLDGLSPRVRGNPWPSTSSDWTHRSIPARAGEPQSRRHRPRIGAVYPRACGGTGEEKAADGKDVGLSPRVRGNPRRNTSTTSSPGSIPARAGEPRGFLVDRSLPWVYPRACGGTDRDRPLHRPRPGLSPRVRGNPGQPLQPDLGQRSIPARAGEPPNRIRTWAGASVYPRACGGTLYCCSPYRRLVGLSPRVRGNPGSRAG